MKYLLMGLMALFLAVPAAAQFSVNPNAGAAFILKDGEVTRVGEVLADVGYQFPYNDAGTWYGEVLGLWGLGDAGNTLGGIGLRTYRRVAAVYPGFGVQAFVVDASVPDVAKTTLTVAPELIFEIPWSTETAGPNGEIIVNESMVAAYGAVYFPVAGGDDFTMVRFGLRVGI